MVMYVLHEPNVSAPLVEFLQKLHRRVSLFSLSVKLSNEREYTVLKWQNIYALYKLAS